MNYFTSLYRPMPQLNAASTPLAGTELMRVYQDGEERQTPVSSATAGSQPLDSTLTAISALTGTGLIARTGNGDTDAAVRTITQSTGITVANGSGVAGNPTISISNTGVSAATYGSATKAVQIAVNAQGQITSASEVTIVPVAPGSTTQILFNDGGAIAGDAGLTYDAATDVPTAAGGYRSGNPTTGTAATWKLGSLVTAAVVPDTTRYIELDVGGTLYKLIVST